MEVMLVEVGPSLALMCMATTSQPPLGQASDSLNEYWDIILHRLTLKRGQLARRVSRPVSYTHLTLPTILLV